MNSNERNRGILEHIIKYCDEIFEAQAHKYGDISTTTVWEAITDDVPMLRDYCNNILEKYHVQE